MAPLWARHLAPLWAKCLHGHNAHARASVTALAHLPRASLLCSVAATHRGWRHHRSRPRCVPHSRGPHGESQCILTTRTIATDTTITRVLVIALANFPRASFFCSVAAAHSGWRQHCSRSRCVLPSRDPAARASASPLLTPSPRAPRSHACLCDCAGSLALHATPLQSGRHAQRLAPPPLTVALCASLPRPPRREPVHPHRSRRLHAPDAHARASVIVLAHLPRTLLLCSVAAAPIGWRHHRSRSRCVPPSRDPHGENRCIPTAHTVSTRTTLTRVPL